jgi:hypothetical protein
MPMARQWLRKSEIDKWPWRGDHILESTVAGCRTATAAEWLVKIFVLVFVNTLFLLAALHLLHSGIDLDGDEDPRSCISSATPMSTRPSNLRRGYLSTEGMSDSSGLTMKVNKFCFSPNHSPHILNTLHVSRCISMLSRVDSDQLTQIYNEVGGNILHKPNYMTM